MYIFQYNWIMVRNYRLDHSILKMRSTMDRYCLRIKNTFYSYDSIEINILLFLLFFFSRNIYQKSPQAEAALLKEGVQIVCVVPETQADSSYY